MCTADLHSKCGIFYAGLITFSFVVHFFPLERKKLAETIVVDLIYMISKQSLFPLHSAAIVHTTYYIRNIGKFDRARIAHKLPEKKIIKSVQ